MVAIVFFAALAVAVIGVQRNIRDAQMTELCRRQGLKQDSYNFLFTVLSGLGLGAALVGLMMMSGGSMDKAGLVLGGLAVSVLPCLPAIRQANENLRVLKKHGESDGGQYSPVKVWLGITLVGLGKVIHAIMICTIIGIPLYNMLAQTQGNMDRLVRQVELRQRVEQLKKAEEKRETDHVIQETARNCK